MHTLFTVMGVFFMVVGIIVCSALVALLFFGVYSVVVIRPEHVQEYERRRALRKWRKTDSDPGHTLYHDFHSSPCPDDCPYIPEHLRSNHVSS